MTRIGEPWQRTPHPARKSSAGRKLVAERLAQRMAMECASITRAMSPAAVKLNPTTWMERTKNKAKVKR